MKVIEFPKKEREDITLPEVLEIILERCSEEETTQQFSISNMIVIGENPTDYTYAVYDGTNIRSLIGILELVKAELIMVLQTRGDYEII